MEAWWGVSFTPEIAGRERQRDGLNSCAYRKVSEQKRKARGVRGDIVTRLL